MAPSSAKLAAVCSNAVEQPTICGPPAIVPAIDRTHGSIISSIRTKFSMVMSNSTPSARCVGRCAPRCGPTGLGTTADAGAYAFARAASTDVSQPGTSVLNQAIESDLPLAMNVTWSSGLP